MEREFKIVGILLRGETVILQLQPLITKKVMNIPETDEERVAFKIMDGVVRAMKQMSLQGLIPYLVGEPPRFDVELTKEEYELIGSPTLNQIVEVEFKEYRKPKFQYLPPLVE